MPRVLTNGPEAYKLVREIGAGIKPIKSAIWFVYRRVSAEAPITLSRVKDIWYGDPRANVREEELAALCRVAAEVARRKQEAQRVLWGLAGTYRGAAERLRAIDSVRYSSEITRLEREARALGGDTQSRTTRAVDGSDV